jgi:hypothetical protein
VGGRSRSRILVGFVVLTAGVIILLERLDGVDAAGEFARKWWPIALIGLGIKYCITFASPPYGTSIPAHPIYGAIAVVAIGVAALAATLFSLPNDTQRFVLPSLLIAVGTLMATIGGRIQRATNTWIAETAVFRRVKLSSRARNLWHAELRAVLGEVVLDLSEATTSGAAEVNATVWAGQVRLRLPETMMIEEWREAGPNVTLDIRPHPHPDLEPQLSVCLSVVGAYGRLIVEWKANTRRADQAIPNQESPVPEPMKNAEGASSS